MRLKTLTLIGSFILISLPLTVWAESSSANYVLWGQAIASGGARMTSDSFVNYGTVGDAPNGEPASSATFYSLTGFEGIYEEPVMMMSISATDISLSPEELTYSTVSTGETSVTVGTNADFGYALTATESYEFQTYDGYVIPDVADGAVTAGVEEYGIAVSGADASFSDDRSVSSTSRTVASNDSWTTGVTTTITFKAAVGTGTPAGQYTGSVVFIATGTF